MRPCLQGAPSRFEMIEWRLTPASLAECSFYAKWIARRHPREVSVEQYIEPYVQPIVTPENSTYALEALFRLKGSDELPVRLFRQWKDSGYVRTIDLAMVTALRSALSATRKRMRVAMNVSALTLETAPDEYLAELGALSDVTRRVIVEITDMASTDNLTTLVGFAHRCSTRGIYVALDDGGLCRDTLLAVRPNFVKIGAGVVDEAFSANDPDALRDAVKGAHSLGAAVIAKNVDSAQKLDFVRTAGVDLIQGHCISHPMPLTSWLDPAVRKT